MIRAFLVPANRPMFGAIGQWPCVWAESRGTCVKVSMGPASRQATSKIDIVRGFPDSGTESLQLLLFGLRSVAQNSVSTIWKFGLP